MTIDHRCLRFKGPQGHRRESRTESQRHGQGERDLEAGAGPGERPLGSLRPESWQRRQERLRAQEEVGGDILEDGGEVREGGRRLQEGVCDPQGFQELRRENARQV